jgi:hypothetical protein
MPITTSSWLSDVSSRVPGASETEILTAIGTIVREFCTKTLLYIKQLTAIDVIAGTGTYILTAPTGYAIIGTERVELNGQYVDATSLDLLDRSPENWQVQTSDQPQEYIIDAEKQLRFKDIPSVSYTAGLIVWASLKPAITATGVPDFIYDDWYETILNGSVTYLLRMPNKNFTSLEGSQFFENIYRGSLSEAKGKKFTGKAKVSIRVQTPPFTVIG